MSSNSTPSASPNTYTLNQFLAAARARPDFDNDALRRYENEQVNLVGVEPDAPQPYLWGDWVCDFHLFETEPDGTQD